MLLSDFPLFSSYIVITKFPIITLIWHFVTLGIVQTLNVNHFDNTLTLTSMRTTNENAKMFGGQWWYF